MRFRLFALFLITSLVIILYYGTLDNEFTYWDDNKYVTGNETIRNLDWNKFLNLLNPRLYISGVDGLFRLPLSNISYAVDYHFWKLNPTGFHITNIFLYILVSIVLYLFLEKVTAVKAIALMGALLFVVHPVHVESVAWVSTRKDLFSLLFFLLSFLFYIQYNSKRSRRWRYYVGSVFLFFLALLSKSLLVYGPLLFILYDLCFEQKKAKELFLDKVPFLALSAIISFVIMNIFKPLSEGYLTGHIGPYRLVLTNFQILREYIFMLILPANLSAYYAYYDSDLPTSIFEVQSVISILFITLILTASIIAYLKDKRIVTFCVIWFFIALIPVLNIAPTSTIKADRYLFVPSIGFSLLVAYVTYNLFSLSPNRILKGVVSAVFIIILTFFSTLTIERNNIWQNGITLWQDAIAKNSENIKAHFGLGNEYRHRKNWDAAIRKYELVLKLNPNFTLACGNLGASYGAIERYEKAISVLKRCLEIDSSFTNARTNLAKAYLSLGDKYLARQELAEILRRDPNNTKALRMLEGF